MLNKKRLTAAAYGHFSIDILNSSVAIALTLCRAPNGSLALLAIDAAAAAALAAAAAAAAASAASAVASSVAAP